MLTRSRSKHTVSLYYAMKCAHQTSVVWVVLFLTAPSGTSPARESGTRNNPMFEQR